jgi:cytochrome c-type biogenesis protein CcmF
MENVSLNGVGLNEALKSPWMVIHPPLVFIGYTTMAVLFSLAVNNKSISNYIIKRWIYLSVIFLGLGIFTGSIWAYKELGWGGYWSWDPIENSALVPWIILCAYLHDKKHIGRLKCIIPFLLAVFGTFLTRSGILKNKSVHSYITASSNVNIVILIGFVFIGVIIVSIIIKNIVRERSLNSSIMSYFKVISYIYAGSIFIGTILPLFVNIHIKITYYNIVSIVYIVLVSLIMIIYYKNIVASKYIITLMANTLLTVSIIFIYATYDLKWLVICFICLMPITLLVISFITYRNNRDIKYYIIHLGVFLLIIGAITSSALGKKEISMCEIKTNNVSVEDHKVPILKLMKEKMVITNNIKEDTIICYNGISIDRSTIFITEKTKPLIILFWGGGYLIIVGAIISLYKYRKS